MGSACEPGVFDDGGAGSLDGEVRALKALGDEKRLRIMRLIAENPGICSCKVLERFSMSQSTLSHHMKLLCSAGLVDCEKDGKWVHYSVNQEGIESLIACLGRIR